MCRVVSALLIPGALLPFFRSFVLPFFPLYLPVSVETHRAKAPTSVRCAVLTISDTRTIETDSGGDSLVRRLTEAGHEVCARQLGTR